MAITSFTGPYAFLSNFFPCEIEFRGEIWPNVEFAYQFAKIDTRHKDYQCWLVKMKNTKTNRDAKYLGRAIPLRENWGEVRLAVMHDLVYQKFVAERNRNFYGRMLLNTGNEHLVEGNWWGDIFWGQCNGIGENWLGTILEDVRAELRRLKGADIRR